MRLIDVYQAASNDGYSVTYTGLFRSYDEALRCSYGSMPLKRQAAETDDGFLYVIEWGPVRADDDLFELRRRALAKLTPQERSALGLAEQPAPVLLKSWVGTREPPPECDRCPGYFHTRDDCPNDPGPAHP